MLQEICSSVVIFFLFGIKTLDNNIFVHKDKVSKNNYF